MDIALLNQWLTFIGGIIALVAFVLTCGVAISVLLKKKINAFD